MTTAYDKLNGFLACMVWNAKAYDETGNPVYHHMLESLTYAFNREFELLQNVGFTPIDWTMNA